MCIRDSDGEEREILSHFPQVVLDGDRRLGDLIQLALLRAQLRAEGLTGFDPLPERLLALTVPLQGRA